MRRPKKGAERDRDRERVLKEKEKGWLKLGEKESERERFESGRVAIESVCAEETRAGAEKDATTCWRVDQQRQGRSFVVGVCALRTRADRGHVPAESTCRRDTSDTSGQQFSNGTKGSRDSLFPLFFSLGIVCVSDVGGLVRLIRIA